MKTLIAVIFVVWALALTVVPFEILLMGQISLFPLLFFYLGRKLRP
jgi:hypothetical protein